MVTAADHPLERAERAAQPPRRYPHLVYRVGLVPAHHRIERLQRLGLVPQVGEHDLAGRGRRGEPPRPGRRRQLAAEGPLQLGRPARRAQAVAAQQRVGRLEQPPVPAGQLDLKLAPLGYGRRVAHGLGGDVVGRHLGQRLASLAEQDEGLPPGGEPGHRPERRAAGVHADQLGELAGHLPALPRRQPDLAAGAGAFRQLQVPSGVAAAAAAAQRDPGPEQPQVVGVVVLGLELLLVGPGGPVHLRQLVQRRQRRALGHLVFGFCFSGRNRHEPLPYPCWRRLIRPGARLFATPGLDRPGGAGRRMTA